MGAGKNEKNCNSKLTLEQVIKIKHLYWSTKPPKWATTHIHEYSGHKLAKMFGVSYQTIYNIINEVTWKDVH